MTEFVIVAEPRPSRAAHILYYWAPPQPSTGLNLSCQVAVHSLAHFPVALWLFLSSGLLFTVYKLCDIECKQNGILKDKQFTI